MIARIPHSRGPVTLEMASAANPGWKVELEADGSIVMSPTGTLSGAHDIALLALLIEWHKLAGGQLFGSSTGFTMPDKSVLSPDAAWLRTERWRELSAKERDSYSHVVPDVCIEIASKTDSVGTLIAKLQRYRGYGAAYALLIDPYRRKTWSDGTMPPGFPTDFTSVFEAGND